MTQDAHPAFLSYCREDSHFALKLAGDLKAAGASVWIDQLDIEAGQEWDSAIEAAVTRSPRMVVILSPASLSSTVVMDEISFALDRQKTVTPVIYKDCTVPFGLRRLQHVDFRPDYARGLKELLRTLIPGQAAKSGTPLVPIAEPPSSFPRTVTSRAPGSSDIFISYAKEDKARAGQLAEALESLGWTVWWDRRIPIGKSFSQVIQAELQDAKCALVLWSRTSVKSDWVDAEAAKAKQMGKLVPILIEDVGTLIPIEFSRLHAANLCNWCGDAEDPEFQELHDAITQYVPLSNPHPRKIDAKTSKNRR